MSGNGGKSKSQMALSQEGKMTTTCHTTAKAEAQDWGRTRAMGMWGISDDNQEIGDTEKGRSILE